MLTKNRHGKKLITDKNTDLLFDYFMNEDKFNEQLLGQWDEEMEKKLENHAQPKLDSRILTDKKSSKKDYVSSIREKELPTIEETTEKKMDVDFNDDETENNISDSSVQNSTKSPYRQKINAVEPVFRHNKIKSSKYKPKETISDRQILGQKLIEDIKKYKETPETRRARARDAYSNLQHLKQKYNVTLSRDYTIDDDPDEMEAEHTMLKDRRHKNNQIKLYKNIFLNIICGCEFLNEHYNPFEFKLKDWSKTVASDMNEYVEILEEIYEKYKHIGGGTAPEIRLLFMIVMSGVTYHLSQTLFGSDGLGDAVKNNPNAAGKLLNGLLKGGMFGGNKDSESNENVEAPQHNKNILDAIRKHNKNKQTETTVTNTTEGVTETNQKKSDSTETINTEAINLERKLMAERIMHDTQMKKQNELYMAQLNDLQNKLYNNTTSNNIVSNNATSNNTASNNNISNNNIPQAQILSTLYSNNNNYLNEPVNHVLSDVNIKPRFQENPLLHNNNHQYPKTIINEPQTRESLDLFDSDKKDNSKIINKHLSLKKPNKKQLDELMETLEESTDVDLDDIIETSNKKKNINSLTKPTTISKRSKNNTNTSLTKKKGNSSVSDILSATKRNNIVKL